VTIEASLLLILFPLTVLSPGFQEFSRSQQSHELKVTTRLVQVTVVAQDSKGRAVTDLTRDDFELTDRGKPQTVSLFTEERSSSPSRTHD
jgi:hypothetical protein